MAKFKLVADPTFKCKVLIPRAGQEDGEIELTFKHYIKDTLIELENELQNKPEIDFVMKLVSGWNLNEEFNKENMNILLNNYPAAIRAIMSSYYKEMLGQREKN